MKTAKLPATEDYVISRQDTFRQLSASRKSALRRDARRFIQENPGCADHSRFWRGLSARQVLAAK